MPYDRTKGGRKMNKKIILCLTALCMCLVSTTLGVKAANAPEIWGMNSTKDSGYRLVYEEISEDLDPTLKKYYTYDKATGNLITERWVSADEDKLYKYEYDEAGRRIRTTTTYKDDPKIYGYECEYEGDENSLLTRTYDIDSETGSRKFWYMDKEIYSKKRLVKHVYYEGMDPEELYKYKYDKKGNLKKESFYKRVNGKWVYQNADKYTYEKVNGIYVQKTHTLKQGKYVYNEYCSYNSHGDIKQVSYKTYKNGKRREDLDQTYYYNHKYDKAGNVIRTKITKKGSAVYYRIYKYKWEPKTR